MAEDWADSVRRIREDFRALVQSASAWSDAAMQRSPAEVIAADEAETMTDENFDVSLWWSLFGRIDASPTILATLPAGVRMYFATRVVEMEVTSDGFAAALDNVGEFFDEAVAGYRMLGDEASAALLERAQNASDADALDALDEELPGPRGEPWSNDVRVRYVRSHRDEFRLL